LSPERALPAPPEADDDSAERTEQSGELLGAAPTLLPDAADLQRKALLHAQLFGDFGTPVKIGRFAVLRTLGAGGMGVVYAAQDEELARKVAIKVLRGKPAADGRQLLREAQALARLAHPNVVGIHEVGVHDGRVFLAMEFVEGRTATAWQRERPRSVRETLGIYTQAGRGLAAAHAAGLVHRDVKPDNILVGVDGRVRVLDFGLARLHDRTGPEVLHHAETLATGLLATGGIAGTPAYMAPEQFLGAAPDARSDQFSLCVALYEALFGRRPFPGESVRGLIAAVTLGEPRPPSGRRVPAKIRRAVMRGLARDPARRWPSIDALLAALEPGPDRARRWIAAAGLVFAGATAAAVMTRADAPCTTTGDELDDLWGPSQREATHAAFLATGAPFATAAFTRSDQQLTTYLSAWQDMRTASCEATHVRHTQSMTLLDLRTACLDRRREDARALIALLADADADMVAHAVQATGELASLAACSDVEALTQAVPPPDDPAVRHRVDELRDVLAQARALQVTGKYVRGRDLALHAVTAATPLAYPPLTAEALVLAGELHIDAGEPAAAEQTLLAAVRAASAGARDDLLAHAWIDLMHVVGIQLGRHAEAEHWGRIADVAVVRVADPPPLRARLLAEEGALLKASGVYGPALAKFREALALQERTLPPDDPALSSSLTSVGNASRSLGAFAEALTYHQRALDLRIQAFGPDHPEVAQSHHNLASTLDDLGRHADALVQNTRALEIARNTLPPNHPVVASIEMGLGATLVQTGDPIAARTHFDAVLRAWTATLGQDHPNIALIHSNLGGLAFRAGEIAAALAHAQRAVAIFEKVFGPDHPPLAGALDLVGMCNDRLGDPTRALAMFEQAMAIRTTHLPPDHPELAMSHSNLASALYALNRRDEALNHDLTALAIAERTHGADHELLISMHDNLALSLMELRRHDDALAHYQRALAIAERACGRECPAVVVPLTGIGDALIALGRTRKAVPELQRALAVGDQGSSDPIDVAAARFAMARALWASRQDRKHAVTLAREARATYADGGPALTEQHTTVEHWLAAHR
jgi:eukaryotic-like serine/threonine-protein kinase